MGRRKHYDSYINKHANISDYIIDNYDILHGRKETSLQRDSR
jgi:hypothetical protein